MTAPDRHSARTMYSLALVLGLLLGVAGCSGLRSSDPVVQVYPLQPRVAAATGAGGNAPGGNNVAPQPVAGTLAVMLPLAAPGLNTVNIALMRPDGVQDAYAASRWPELLPEVLQPLIIDALRAGGRFANVQPDSGPFKADYLLQVEVRQFAAVYAGDVQGSAAPMVQVQLVATLGRRADRSVLRSYTASGSATASANRMSAVMGAYNSALGTALQQLVAGTQIAP